MPEFYAELHRSYGGFPTTLLLGCSDYSIDGGKPYNVVFLDLLTIYL